MGFGRWGERDGNIRQEITISSTPTPVNFNNASSSKYGTVAVFTQYNASNAIIVRVDLSGSFSSAGNYFTTISVGVAPLFCSTYYQDASGNNYFVFPSDRDKATARISLDNGGLIPKASTTFDFKFIVSVTSVCDSFNNRYIFSSGADGSWEIRRWNLVRDSLGVISGFDTTASSIINFTNTTGNPPSRAYYMNGTLNANYFLACSSPSEDKKCALMQYIQDLSAQYVYSLNFGSLNGTNYGGCNGIANDYTTPDASNNFYVITNDTSNNYIHKLPMADSSGGIVSNLVTSYSVLNSVISDPSANNVYITDNSGRVFYIEKNFSSTSVINGPFPLSVAADQRVITRGGIYDHLNNYLMVPKGGTKNMLFFNLNKDQPN
jgi:hypothetical protein